MSATRGDLGTDQSGANRRGREKRRGRNEAAEVRPRTVDAVVLERWRGEEPQERSRRSGWSLSGPDVAEAGRKALSSEGEVKFKRGIPRFLTVPECGPGEDGKGCDREVEGRSRSGEPMSR
jgi:hypothetical protein